MPGLRDFGAEVIPPDYLFNGAERIRAVCLCVDDRGSEAGQQADFAVDGALVAFQRSLFPAFSTPEHLSDQSFEHHHGIVGQDDLHFDDGGDPNWALKIRDGAEAEIESFQPAALKQFI